MDGEVIKKVILKLRQKNIDPEILEEVGETMEREMGLEDPDYAEASDMIEADEDAMEDDKQTDLAPGKIEMVVPQSERQPKEEVAQEDMAAQIFSKDDMGKPGLKGKVAMRAKGMMK